MASADTQNLRPRPRQRRRRRLRLVGLAVVAAVAGPGAALTAHASSTALGFTAESSALSTFAMTSNASVTAPSAHGGTNGVLVAAQAGPGVVHWTSKDIEQGHGYAGMRLWFRLVSRGAGESVDVATLSNTQSKDNFDLFITGDTRHFKWDLNSVDFGESADAVEYGRWYYLEVQVDFSGTTHTAAVRIDGVAQPGVTSTGIDTDVAGAKFGSYQVKTHTQHYDDLAVRVGDAAVGWLPTPSHAPAASGACVGVSYALKGRVIAYGVASSYYFQYGTTTSYGSTTPTGYVTTDAPSPAVSIPVAGLAANTTYHYRLVAQNDAGTVYGSDKVMRTASGAC